MAVSYATLPDSLCQHRRGSHHSICCWSHIPCLWAMQNHQWDWQVLLTMGLETRKFWKVEFSSKTTQCWESNHSLWLGKWVSCSLAHSMRQQNMWATNFDHIFFSFSLNLLLIRISGDCFLVYSVMSLTKDFATGLLVKQKSCFSWWDAIFKVC